MNTSMKRLSGITVVLVLSLLISFSAVSAQSFDPPVVTIMDIQGAGQFSPLEGDVVTTTGVVTLISANGRDMWIQDIDGDGDPTTSDGIFVDDRDRLEPQPEVGDLIRITGEVEELQFGNALPLTRLDDPDDYLTYEIIAGGQELPQPITISDLPDISIEEATLKLESLEGMRVHVDNAPVVAGTSRFGEFVVLTKKDAKPNSGFFPQVNQILLRSLGPNDVDYNPERLMIDDVTLESAIIVNPGDRVRSLVGVMDYTFGNYKIQPETFDVKTHRLPNQPASSRSGPPGNVVITTLNVENLFDLVLNTPSPVDIFGEIGVDPGSGWGPPSTQNNTLRRKDNVCQTRGVNGPFDPSTEWNEFGIDSFDGLGGHSVTCGVTNDLIISEYVEGSSLNKAVEIYNGTGTAIDQPRKAMRSISTSTDKHRQARASNSLAYWQTAMSLWSLTMMPTQPYLPLRTRLQIAVSSTATMQLCCARAAKMTPVAHRHRIS